MNTDNLSALENLISYKFKNRELLICALTHSSTGEGENYERLEFLGDRVVGLVVADMLLSTFPNEQEGDLAKRHAALVQGKTMALIAEDLKLGEYMLLSDAERASGGDHNQNILADGVEALIAAIYFDGGLQSCKNFIEPLWADYLHDMSEPPLDPKTTLQEWAQARALPLPNYEIVQQDGPDHAPLFFISVEIQGYEKRVAKGASRRKAEKNAARDMLEFLEHRAKDSHKERKT